MLNFFAHGEAMRRDLWPLKAIFAVGAVFFGGGDMTFPGEPFSPAILLMLGLLLAGEALSDREMQKIEDDQADKRRAAEAAEREARKAREAEDLAEKIKESRRIFTAGKRLGFMIASYAYNDDLLRMKNLAPESRQKLEEKQGEIRKGIEEIRRNFGHLDSREDA